MRFFHHYNRIMKITYVVVALVCLGLFLLHARSRYENKVNLMKERFRETASSLDYYLKSTVDHVSMLKMRAEMHFSQDQDIPTSCPLFNHLANVPGRHYYSLDRLPGTCNPMHMANLTGRGSLQDLSPALCRELRIALFLTPLFEITRKNLPHASWVYYTSAREFIIIYPWIHSREFHFNESIFEEEFYLLGTPEKNSVRRRFWTRAYIDQAGKGLMVTCGAPTYERELFKGTVSVDFTLDTLNDFVRAFPHPEATVFLVNDRNELLAHPELVSSKDREVKSIHTAFPKNLPIHIDRLFQMKSLERKIIRGKIFFYQQLGNAPWRLVFLGSKKAIILRSLLESGYLFIVLLLGLSLMLLISHRVTRREFIEPAQKLVAHIENASREPGAPIPAVPEAWRPWFETITRIFRENSRLLEELRERNEELDALVARRTAQLRQRNDELEETLSKLKEMQRQIIVQEKMASLGALTGGIAHEIKNPLNFVNNFSELSEELFQELRELLEEKRENLEPELVAEITELVDTLQQNIGKIKEHGKRADNIVRSMLLHSRGETGARQETDVNALVDEYVNLAYHGMRARDRSFNVKFETDYDSSIGKQSVVPQDLGRAVLNIVNNACYAVNTKKNAENPPDFVPTVKIRTQKRNNNVAIIIHDNGMGIPADLREKIFTPFYTTKPAGEGTGLGLSITYDVIVQEHGGEIMVDSEPGNYTEFTILLPISC